jgi:hypothetical protein
MSTNVKLLGRHSPNLYAPTNVGMISIRTKQDNQIKRLNSIDKGATDLHISLKNLLYLLPRHILTEFEMEVAIDHSTGNMMRSAKKSSTILILRELVRPSRIVMATATHGWEMLLVRHSIRLIFSKVLSGFLTICLSFPGRKRQPLPPQSERFKEVAAGPPAPSLPAPRHVTNGPLSSVAPSGPRRLPPREVNPIDSVQQGRVHANSQRKDFEDMRGQVGNSSQTRAFETKAGFAEGKHYEERGRPKQWDRERERTFPADLPTGPRAMDLDAEPPIFVRRGRSPMRQPRDASPPSHLPTSGPRYPDRRDHFASGGLKHSFNATDRAYREQDRQGGPRLGEVGVG